MNRSGALKGGLTSLSCSRRLVDEAYQDRRRLYSQGIQLDPKGGLSIDQHVTSLAHIRSMGRLAESCNLIELNCMAASMSPGIEQYSTLLNISLLAAVHWKAHSLGQDEFHCLPGQLLNYCTAKQTTVGHLPRADERTF